MSGNDSAGDGSSRLCFLFAAILHARAHNTQYCQVRCAPVCARALVPGMAWTLRQHARMKKRTFNACTVRWHSTIGIRSCVIETKKIEKESFSPARGNDEHCCQVVPCVLCLVWSHPLWTTRTHVHQHSTHTHTHTHHRKEQARQVGQQDPGNQESAYPRGVWACFSRRICYTRVHISVIYYCEHCVSMCMQFSFTDYVSMPHSQMPP